MLEFAGLVARIANIESEIKDIHTRMDQIYEILSERHEGDERITELRFPRTGKAVTEYAQRTI